MSDDEDDDDGSCNLGPWREPLDDSEDFEDPGDGECFVALSSRTATGASVFAAVERWLRMPHHYSLREYLDYHKARTAPDNGDAKKGERSDD